MDKLTFQSAANEFMPDGWETPSGQYRSKAELIPRINSGEVDHLDFKAKVFIQGKNRNHYRFNDSEIPNFAGSFEGQPFLRNHDTINIESRDGVILRLFEEYGAMIQEIRLTSTKGMLAFLDGQIDRFSIGWFYESVTCSICGEDFRSCTHWPGENYADPKTGITSVCEVIFNGVSGKETSAVNVPAVEGTQILGTLKYHPQLNRGYRGDPFTQPTKEKQIMTELSTTNTRPADDGNTDALPIMPAQTEESRALLQQQCDLLLHTTLQKANLPQVTKDRIKRQFNGKVFLLANVKHRR